MSQGIRVAIGQFNELTEEKLLFARQLGVSGIQMNNPKLPGKHRWEFEDLSALRQKVDAFGLVFEAIENVPIHFYDKAMLGLPGRDEQIDHYIATVRNIARAGIPILGIHWMPNSVWRTSRTTPGRGGAHVTSFDLALVDTRDKQRKWVEERRHSFPLGTLPLLDDEAEISEEQMWENYAYFMKAVLPVCEEVGVKLAIHPDDPPCRMLGGIARIFNSVDGFKKGMGIANSPAWGLDLCLGSVSEMEGGAPNVFEMIQYFGEREKILYVHFRDVQGTVPKFQECFVGEGNYDPVEAMRTLKRVGFRGFLLDDHVPHTVDDTPWAHRGRAHAIGYLQALIDAVVT